MVFFFHCEINQWKCGASFDNRSIQKENNSLAHENSTWFLKRISRYITKKDAFNAMKYLDVIIGIKFITCLRVYRKLNHVDCIVWFVWLASMLAGRLYVSCCSLIFSINAFIWTHARDAFKHVTHEKNHTHTQQTQTLWPISEAIGRKFKKRVPSALLLISLFFFGCCYYYCSSSVFGLFDLFLPLISSFLWPVSIHFRCVSIHRLNWNEVYAKSFISHLHFLAAKR